MARRCGVSLSREPFYPNADARNERAESVDRTVSAKADDDDAARRAAASERVMVCLPSRPPPHGVLLLRQGSRLAGRLNTDWFVVHVETKSEAGHRIDATLQRYLLDDEQRARGVVESLFCQSFTLL